jgi:hypothetical protein
MADAKSKEEATSGNAFMIDARAAKIQAKDCRERERKGGECEPRSILMSAAISFDPQRKSKKNHRRGQSAAALRQPQSYSCSIMEL